MSPYNGNITDQFSNGSQETGVSWRLFIFLFIVFGVSIASYIGLQFGYKAYLNNSIANLSSQVQLLSSKLEFRNQNDLVNFYSQVVNLRGLLRSHVFGSKIFALLESETNTRVSFTNVVLNIPENGVVIDGLAATYENLVQQLIRWEQTEGVDSLALEENSTVNDMVRFRVALNFAPGYFGGSDLALPAAPVSAPDSNQ